MTALRSHPRTVAVLALLIAIRVTLPLLVLARSGHALLGGFPVYRFQARPGDGYGYYSAMRELINTWQTQARFVLPAALAAVVVLAWLWRRSRLLTDRAAVRTVVVAWVLALVATVLAATMRNSGAPTIGWPLVWSVPLLPLRALGLALDPRVAFGFGLALSLCALACTLVATYLLALSVSRRPPVALFATGLLACWPLVALVLAGRHGATNGTWQVDMGLSMYTEPLSTALVIGALAIIVRDRVTSAQAALAGALLGFATTVRLSDGVIAGCVAVALLVLRRRKTLGWFAAGGLAFAPLVAVYWPKGYAGLPKRTVPKHDFAFGYFDDAWSHSYLWHPAVLVVIVPLAVLGALAIRRASTALLCACVAVTAVFYTFYWYTPIHPRFLFVVLPIVLVYWAAGLDAVVSTLRSRRPRPA